MPERPKKTIVDAYRSLGVVLINEDAEQAYAEICPFCGGEEKFALVTSGDKIGQWRCWACESGSAKGGGNIYTFINLLAELSLSETTADDYKSLWKQKLIVPSTAERCGVCRSSITGEWLLPTYNQAGRVTNLSRWDQSSNKIYNLETLPISLLGLKFLSTDPSRPIWVAEGWWDYLVDEYVLTATGRRTETDLLAVPGTATFKDEWAQLFSNRESVIFLYDNDHPKQLKTGKIVRHGWDGMVRSAKIIQAHATNPPEPLFVHWPDGLADGYDQRDLFRDLAHLGSERASGVCDFIFENVGSPPASVLDGSSTSSQKPQAEEQEAPLEPLPVADWQDLIHQFKQQILLTRSMQDALATMFGVVISTPLGDDPIWMFINGQPGSGKSTLCLCFAAAKEFCIAIDRFTGLHSGWRPTSKQKKTTGQKNASLWEIINGLTWVIKDWTMFMTSSDVVQKTVNGELRDGYDGETSNHYRHMESSSFKKIRFSMLAGVTDEIYVSSNAHLGERFLIMDITDDFHGSHNHISQIMRLKRSALFSSFPTNRQESQDAVSLDRLAIAKRLVIGYLNTLRDRMRSTKPPDISLEAETHLINMARTVAAVRGHVRREKQDGAPLTHTRHEIASRLIGQFQKLAVCLAVVLEKEEVDADVLQIVRNVARHTARSYKLDIVGCLANAHTQGALGLDLEAIFARIGLKQQTVNRCLQDLQELKVVSRVKARTPSGVRGRYQHLWQLLPDYRKMWPSLDDAPR